MVWIFDSQSKTSDGKAHTMERGCGNTYYNHGMIWRLSYAQSWHRHAMDNCAYVRASCRGGRSGLGSKIVFFGSRGPLVINNGEGFLIFAINLDFLSLDHNSMLKLEFAKLQLVLRGTMHFLWMLLRSFIPPARRMLLGASLSVPHRSHSSCQILHPAGC